MVRDTSVPLGIKAIEKLRLTVGKLNDIVIQFQGSLPRIYVEHSVEEALCCDRP